MEVKIVFAGTMGAGKTTAITQISDTAPIATDVANTRRDEHTKATTTAAFDYGEVDLGDGEVLHLYGAPGQERFSFMWPVLARGALGIVHIVDNSRPEPLVDLAGFIDNFGAITGEIPGVVAINKSPPDTDTTAPVFEEYLAHRGLSWPVIDVDLRQRGDVLDVLEILLGLSEAEELEDATP